MAWVFDLDTGEFSKSGKVFCHTEKYNMPVGTYAIGYARTHPDLGEVTMEIYQYHDGVRHSAGFICGDAACVGGWINLPRIVRLRIATSEDRVLEVVKD